MSTRLSNYFYLEAKVLTLEEVRKRLQDRRIDVVAEATGLHYGTVQEVRAGKSENPSYQTIKVLSDYFEEKKDV